jgi:hypothetical protein
LQRYRSGPRKEVKYEQVTSQKFVELVWKKPDPFLVQHLHEVGIDHGGTNNLIQQIGGLQPMSLGNFALQTRQADVETGSEAVSAASCAQVRFGVNRHVRWQSDLPFAGRELYRTEETN